MFRNLRMRWELRRGRALDIWSTGEYPSDVLSNLCSNRFRLDGIECQSMEGFLQYLKYEDQNRQGTEYQDLLRRAYQAMFNQNDRFRAALMASRGRILYHSHGNTNPFKTILTQEEFCSILMEIRDAYDARDKQLPSPPRTVCIAVTEFLESNEDPLETLRMISQNYDCHLYISIPSTKDNLNLV